MRLPIEWGEFVFDELMKHKWKEMINTLLGWNCAHCSNWDNLIDIHHVKHDGRAWREIWGGYTSAYYFDILWGVMHNCGEVILLCRKCHKTHHNTYGYEELD